MIESVGTSSVQGASLRINPQAGSSYAVSGAAAAAVQSDLPKYGTRLAVRLDSAAQRAILEVRSSETGEVVNQYPSEAQMRAFQQAARLDVANAQAARQQAAAQAAKPQAQTPSFSSEQAIPVPQKTAPAPQQQASIPVPQTAEIKIADTSAPARQSSGSGDGNGAGVLV